MFCAASHRMIEYPHFHFALIRVIDVQPNTTYFPNFFSSLLITVFPKVHEKKCSTYTPSHCGATAAPSALCDIRLFLPGRNRYYDSVLSASHSSNDVKHTCEVRSLPGEMFHKQSPLLQANTPAMAHITPNVCVGYASLLIRRPARITMSG
jgi:hypothetical protein